MRTTVLNMPLQPPGLVSGRRRSKSLAHDPRQCVTCALKMKYDERIQNILLAQLNFI